MSTQRDWAHDYDVLDPEYAADPYPIWDELRDDCRSRTPTDMADRG